MHLWFNQTHAYTLCWWPCVQQCGWVQQQHPSRPPPTSTHRWGHHGRHQEYDQPAVSWGLAGQVRRHQHLPRDVFGAAGQRLHAYYQGEKILHLSPGAHLHIVGMLCFTELAHFFLFCSCVCFNRYDPFNCISFHNSPQRLSAFSLSSAGLISALLVLSTVCLFMKVSFSPDIILCGWQGLKHQLTILHPKHEHSVKGDEILEWSPSTK